MAVPRLLKRGHKVKGYETFSFESAAAGGSAAAPLQPSGHQASPAAAPSASAVASAVDAFVDSALSAPPGSSPALQLLQEVLPKLLQQRVLGVANLEAARSLLSSELLRLGDGVRAADQPAAPLAEAEAGAAPPPLRPDILEAIEAAADAARGWKLSLPAKRLGSDDIAPLVERLMDEKLLSELDLSAANQIGGEGLFLACALQEMLGIGQLDLRGQQGVPSLGAEDKQGQSRTKRWPEGWR